VLDTLLPYQKGKKISKDLINIEARVPSEHESEDNDVKKRSKVYFSNFLLTWLLYSETTQREFNLPRKSYVVLLKIFQLAKLKSKTSFLRKLLRMRIILFCLFIGVQADNPLQ